ncbi:hypothetical protein B0O40_0384 [Ruminococcaceae bacterium R-25]|nr:hypothetical protein B0O40_0384 [Ruminococcaceae bacterium R-25]SUQ11021.1 hypothetical protein SAMN06297423_0384 [Oscillospiraceae bacterium]
MLINEMFKKDINRHVRGVIVVGEDEESYIKQDLEEYVVTKELQKYFADFFSAYKNGIIGNTPDMAVWIAGFFGSGKSHFLKILSYILQNKVVDGKKAIDYFIDDNKITDSMVLADIKLATETPTDVISFDIAAKSSNSGNTNKDSIVRVFLRVFNEMQGFCGSMPYLADLEKRLTDIGKYDEFKKVFEEEYGSSWVESRSDFDFIQDTVVDVLAKTDVMSEDAARNWCEKSTEDYEITIEEFAERVQKYIEMRGNNHHVVFLVDEVGQYIVGENPRLMLDLQTIVHELRAKCKGKAWVVVTSQQDVDSIAKVIGQDFSKIQGRFTIRISMSSANVDEVIKKRILEKNETAAQSLRLLYQNKATIIKNLIIFNDGVEKKLYANEDDFATVYPFIPYQFNVLASVLTSIRTHGASGKHLSEGERSMLALFKESAMKIGDQAMGAIIPFHKFYDALENFLDHSHRGVILKAYENSHINPEGKQSDVFEINVLKTLFMIKYIAEVDPNIENITSLMISSIDEDRLQLKNKVDAALRVLDSQKVIQKNGDSYMFLTDEEQDIRREIDSQNVDQAEIINKVSEIIFEDILPEKKYKYSQFGGRYTFSFNQFVDERPYKSGQAYDIGLRILTPWYTRSTHDSTLRMVSGESKEVIVLLPNDATFLSEISTYLKIEKFLRLNTSDKLVKYEAIRNSVTIERRERGENAKTFLKDNLAEATIYVNGDVVSLNSKDYQNKINEALGKLVATVYNKLYYIEHAFDSGDVRRLFEDHSANSLKLDEVDTPVNKHALDDVLSFISLNTKAHMKISMKAVKEQFMKAPYGFVEDDIYWLVAKLFITGKLTFTVNGENVTLQNKAQSDLIDYITKKQYVEKLLIEERTGVDPKQKKVAKDLIKELFNTSVVNDDEDAIMKDFQTYATNKVNSLKLLEVKYDANHPYPGKETIVNGKNLLITVLQQSRPIDFFKTVFISQDDLRDFAEDLEPIETFFGGEQKEIFDKAVDLLSIFGESKAYIADNEVESLADSIQNIIDEKEPYKDIPKLPELREKFINAYMKILESESKPVIIIIEQDRDRVVEALSDKSYKDEFFDRIWKYYQDLVAQVKKSNNIAKIHGFASQSSASKIKFLNEMDEKDAQLAKETESSDAPASVVAKKVKRMSVKNATGTSSWSIKSKADIDKHLAELKQRLETELEEADEIYIEF